MLQIQPQKNFPITRNLNDPQDSNTYYIKAYVYEGTDADTLLDTVNLVDLGNQRFKKNWQTPVDNSGDGRYITIFTKVFTDNLYTIESDVYGRTEEMFLVKETWNRVYGGGGGGADVSYEKIKKIVEEVVSGKYKETDLKPLLDAINSIEVSSIIKTEKIEIGGIARLIEAVRMKVEALPKPEKPEKVKLEPILTAIEEFGNNLVNNIAKSLNESLEKIKTIITSNDGLREKDKKEILESVKKMKIIINTSEEDRKLEIPEKPKKIRKLRGLKYA